MTPERWKAHRRNLAVESSRTLETTHRRKDGTTHPVEVTVNTFQLEGHDFTFSFAQDITLRKMADAAIKEGALRFRQMSEATFEGIAVIHRNTFMDVSDQFAEMVGYTRDELLRQTASMCVAPEHRDRVTEFVQSGQPEFSEYLALRKDGSVFSVEIRVRTASFGNLEVRVAAVRDITERKRAETELRMSEERFRSTFENALAGMALISPEGQYLMVNPALRRLVKISFLIFGIMVRLMHAKRHGSQTYGNDLSECSAAHG
jgi:PAS domain S-box-containing protein